MEQGSPRTRWLILLGLGAAWMLFILGRLFLLQVVSYGDYLARAQRQQQRIIETSPKRGVLYDRNGHELAMSVEVDSCFADPSEISDPDLVAGLLSGVLGIPSQELRAKLDSSRYFVWIARKLPAETARRIEALNLRGVYFEKENQRFYPEGGLAAHVLGYVDVDEHGLGGIEYSLDKLIRGQPGRMLVLADARHRWLDLSGRSADAGASVTLTLDATIQYIAEKELAAAIQQSHAVAGTVVVQDPSNGEILAMASWPTFNPNDAGAASDEARMNRAVTAAYEPGSTFKLITLAGAIEDGITNPAEVVDCQMGTIVVAGRLIHDWHPFGLLTVSEVLAHSSDVGTIKIALRLGASRFYHYIRAFGFGEPTGILLPGENRGLLRRPDAWTASSIGSLAMGQEISVTPIQLASAVSAIANGGALDRPHVIREVRRGGQLLLTGNPDPRRALDERTAATLRQMMLGVVLEGTGRLASLEGYTVAGKTGTAQKIDPATGRYSATQYYASFVGFAPVNNPALTILVSLDSPVGPHHGGDVAGPVFQRIASQALNYLGVPHDLPVSPAIQHAQFDRGSESSSESSQAPPSPGPPPPSSHVSAQTVAIDEGQAVEVPLLAGETVRAVTEKCAQLGLNPTLVGTGVALQQSPEAGARVLRGTRITVWFGKPAATPSGKGK